MNTTLRVARVVLVMTFLLGALVAAHAQQKTKTSHALSLHGDVKYGQNFTAFEYVNPDAPKGGTVRLATVGTFDSLNPFFFLSATFSIFSSFIKRV